MSACTSIVVSIIVGVFTGWLTSWRVTKYFRKKDERELKEREKYKQREKIQDYIDDILTEVLLLEQEELTNNLKLKRLIMNRQKVINSSNFYVFKSIKGEDYRLEVIKIFLGMERIVKHNPIDYEKLKEKMLEVTEMMLTVESSEMQCNSCKNENKCVKKKKCIKEK